MNTTPASNPAPSPTPTAGRALNLHTVLVPTDFSGPATEALARAEQFARRTGARIVLLHVYDDTDYIQRASGHSASGPLATYRAQARAAVEQELEAVAAASRARGHEVETRFCTGHPARQITAVAAECGADLIVLATHGRTGWKRLVLGSVAELVVRYAPCPVFTHHAHPDAGSGPAQPDASGLAAGPLHLRRILFPTDFSAASNEALPWAEKLARDAGAILTLLHVFTPSRLTDASVGAAGYGLATPLIESVVRSVREDIERELGESCATLRERGIDAEVLLLDGEAAERIAGAAESIHGDLIVLATHGLTGWDRPLLGSTAERVVRHAATPVLVVRARK